MTFPFVGTKDLYIFLIIKTNTMKTYILSIITFMLLSITTPPLFAESNKIVTDTITIKGNCGDCKERIEEAAYVKGVKTAEWDKTTKILTVVYNSEKTNLDKITLAIAKIGHDSKLHTASDKVYKKLPGCCAYRTSTCAHD